MTGTPWHHLTITVDPEVTDGLVEAAVGLGLRQVFVVKARGVLRRQKWGPFTLPTISPMFDILHLLVPEDRKEASLETLVRVGDLTRFGAGAIWSTKTEEFWQDNTVLVDPEVPVPEARADHEFQRDLVAIQCISQVDHAEEIAHAAIEAGSHAPTVCFGFGHGIRDKLNFFLQLTINPKKEFTDLVVGADEAEQVFEAMVEAGHLDKPAQGFIFTRPVDIGLVNTLSYQHRSPYPASMEQIIRAIDQLQGNTNWRRSGNGTTGRPARKALRNLVNLNVIVPRGLGDPASLVAMEAGAGGTSTFYANALPVADQTDEREIMSMSIGAAQVEPVMRALRAMPDLAGKPLVAFTHPSPLAVTYLP